MPRLQATAPDRLDVGSPPERCLCTCATWVRRGRVAGARPAADQRVGLGIAAPAADDRRVQRALRGTPPPAALALQARIRAVRAKQDLWHLRADIYALVKQTYDKWEAQIRIDELDDLFDSSRPRAPFAP